MVLSICIFAMISVEHDDVIIDIKIKLSAVVAGDAEGIHAVAFAQLLDVQARVAPVGFEYQDLIVAQLTNIRGQLRRRALEIVGANDEMHAMGAAVGISLWRDGMTRECA